MADNSFWNNDDFEYEPDLSKGILKRLEEMKESTIRKTSKRAKERLEELKKQPLDQNKEGSNPQPLRSGTKVRITSTTASDATLPKSSDRAIWIRPGYVGVIRDRSEFSNTDYHVRAHLPTGEEVIVLMHTDDLEVLDDTKQTTAGWMAFLKEYREEYKKVAEKRAEVIASKIEGMLEPCKIPFMDINFMEFVPNNGLRFEKMDVGVFNEGKFICYKHYPSDLFTYILHQTVSGEYILYMPEQFLDNLGVSSDIVNQWISFVEGMGFDIKIAYLGKESKDWHKTFPNPENISKWAGMNNGEEKIIAALRKNSYYKILLSPCENPFITQFVYKIINCINNPDKFRIAGLALQIAQKLPDIGNFSAFLMASVLYPNYLGELPGYIKGDKAECFVPDIASIYNTVQKLQKTLSKSGVQKYSSALVMRRISEEVYNKLIDLFKRKDFEEVLKILTTLPEPDDEERAYIEHQINPPKPVNRGKNLNPRPQKGSKHAPLEKYILLGQDGIRRIRTAGSSVLRNYVHINRVSGISGPTDYIESPRRTDFRSDQAHADAFHNYSVMVGITQGEFRHINLEDYVSFSKYQADQCNIQTYKEGLLPLNHIKLNEEKNKKYPYTPQTRVRKGETSDVVARRERKKASTQEGLTSLVEGGLDDWWRNYPVHPVLPPDCSISLSDNKDTFETKVDRLSGSKPAVEYQVEYTGDANDNDFLFEETDNEEDEQML